MQQFVGVVSLCCCSKLTVDLAKRPRDQERQKMQRCLWYCCCCCRCRCSSRSFVWRCLCVCVCVCVAANAAAHLKHCICIFVSLCISCRVGSLCVCVCVCARDPHLTLNLYRFTFVFFLPFGRSFGFWLLPLSALQLFSEVLFVVVPFFSSRPVSSQSFVSF